MRYAYPLCIKESGVVDDILMLNDFQINYSNWRLCFREFRTNHEVPVIRMALFPS